MKSAFNKKDQNKATQSTAELKDGPETKTTKGLHRDGLDNLNKSLSDIDDGSYQINRQEGWIELDVKAGSLFETGTSELKPDAILSLMKLATKLKEVTYSVVIEGYTDNIPIETSQFPSNWELSASRAAAVGRALNSFGVDTKRILVTGYGEQYPIADNSTDEGRSQNRRVNIIIVKDKSVSRIFNPEQDQAHSTFIGGGEQVESKKAPTKKDPSKKEQP
jgi:chemotaxis protein MotB